MASGVELLVKVGKRSNLKLSHCKAYRALTMEELEYTSGIKSDCHIVIIENIDEKEKDRAKSFIKSFTSRDDKNKIWFYVPSSDEITCGIADEFEYNIYLSVDNLYNSIYEQTGFNVGNKMAFRRKLLETASKDDDFSSAFDSSFEGLGETEVSDVEEPIENSITAGAVAEVSGAGIVEETTEDVVDGAVGEDGATSNKDVEATTKPDATIIKNADKSVANAKAESVRKEGTIESKADSVEPKAEHTDVKVERVESVAPTVEDSKEASLLKEEAAKNKELAAINESNLKELTKLKEENSSLSESLVMATSQLEELNKLNKALREKSEFIEKEYNKFISADTVIEDPISLAEYSGLKDEIDELRGTVEKLTNNLNEATAQSDADKEQLEKLSAEREDNKLLIDNLTNQVEALEIEIDSKKEQLEALKDRIASGQVQSKDLSDARIKIDSLEDDVKSLTGELNRHNEETERLKALIDAKSAKVDSESAARLQMIDYMSKAAEQIVILSGQVKTLALKNREQENTIQTMGSSDESRKKIIENQVHDIVKLRAQIADVDRRIEKAVSNERFEKEAVQKENQQLKQDLVDYKNQIEYLEEIVKASGVDANGSSDLVETNNELEETNKTLRNQLSTFQREADRALAEKKQQEKRANALEDQVRQLRGNLKTVSDSLTGGLDVGKLQPIQYRGSGQVITVFGSGSYGITTTAISIARRLAMNNKVIYLDFDMVTPKADAMFRINPMCKNVPGFDSRNPKYTGLGLFFEKGFQFFAANYSRIFIPVEETKARSGLLHYISGLYVKPEAAKILIADMSSLLTVLGNTYRYVIIDFGRLGSSEANDKIIKLFSDASFRNVAVVTNDIFDIRNFKMKIGAAGIRPDNIAWAVNMSTTNSLDARSSQYIATPRFELIPFEPTLYGSRDTFLKARTTKEKLEHLINPIIFG